MPQPMPQGVTPMGMPGMLPQMTVTGVDMNRDGIPDLLQQGMPGMPQMPMQPQMGMGAGSYAPPGQITTAIGMGIPQMQTMLVTDGYESMNGQYGYAMPQGMPSYVAPAVGQPPMMQSM